MNLSLRTSPIRKCPCLFHCVMTLELAQGFSAVQTKLNSAASKMRANWPENYAFSLWLQQRIFPRRWEGGELGYDSEDFWLLGDVFEPWFGKSKEMGKWNGWEEPWDAQDSWKWRRRAEGGQWKIWRRWSGEAFSSCWRKAFPLPLACNPADSSLLLSSTSACA